MSFPHIPNAVIWGKELKSPSHIFKTQEFGGGWEGVSDSECL